MSRKKRIANRKSSALLTVATGAAVCLTGGGVQAVNGMVSASNSAVSNFTATSATINLFSSQVTVLKDTTGLQFEGFQVGSPAVGVDFTGTYTPWWNFPAGVLLTPSVTWTYGGPAFGAMTPGNYFAIRFQTMSVADVYGWVRVAAVTPTTIKLDLWSYANAIFIKTLAESVTTSRLALTDGKEKLHWSNDNEDGVARYEVQSQDASGEWQAADSDVPGNGSYSAKVDSGKTCRLVVEMTDGSTKEIDF